MWRSYEALPDPVTVAKRNLPGGVSKENDALGVPLEKELLPSALMVPDNPLKGLKPSAENIDKLPKKDGAPLALIVAM